MSTTTPAMNLTLANPSDIPALTTILSTSYLPEPIARFYLKSWPSLTALTPFFASRLARRFSQPPSNTQIFKLTDPLTGEIVGTVCVSEEFHVEATVRDPRNPQGDAKASVPPEGIHLEFAGEMMRVTAPLEGVVVGRRHLLVTSFGVLPQHQGRGYGSMLLAKCNEIADEKSLPLFLTALPGAYELYVKFGYVEVARADLDLAKWAKPHTGFGIYRSYAMLREPRSGEE